ncbi:flagellar basal-body MS-ring/collar protein FliF [Pseudomonas aeruginosa]|nr:flagellar basal-body MS-ring/collar protein FliF [Pseudomonas aeruginosa]
MAASTGRREPCGGSADRGGHSYKVEPNSGALLVKADDLGRARMKVASAGVAPTDNNVGFEILDKEQALGTSQFMEATNYRRGLEGELARTVSSLNNVKAARVHLAIPKSSVFVRDDRKPSASVLVELYPGRSLEPSQVMAIVNLVATSVPELDKSQVTVVDQKGNLLSDQQELSELTMAGKQFDFTRRMEGCSPSACTISCNLCWATVAKAEVSADVDFSAVESTSRCTTRTSRPCAASNATTRNGRIRPARRACRGAVEPAAGPGQRAAAGHRQRAGRLHVAPGQPLKDANGQTIIDPKTGKPELAPYPDRQARPDYPQL